MNPYAEAAMWEAIGWSAGLGLLCLCCYLLGARDERVIQRQINAALDRTYGDRDEIQRLAQRLTREGQTVILRDELAAKYYREQQDREGQK